MKRPFRGFTAILYKEFISVLRDPMTLFFMFFPPLIEMIAFGYALDNDVKHMTTVVLDEDRTVQSRRMVDEFVNTQTFRVVKEGLNVVEVPILHPDIPGFEALGLKWYALRLVAGMALDAGGVQYTCAPFNGWSMGTETGARIFTVSAFGSRCSRCSIKLAGAKCPSKCVRRSSTTPICAARTSLCLA